MIAMEADRGDALRGLCLHADFRAADLQPAAYSKLHEQNADNRQCTHLCDGIRSQ
jgi:hypothetical protein